MKDTNRHTNRELYPIEDAISRILFNSTVHTFFMIFRSVRPFFRLGGLQYLYC